MLQLLLSLIVLTAVLVASGKAEGMAGPYALTAQGLEGEMLEGALNPSSAVGGSLLSPRYRRAVDKCECPCSSAPCCCQCFIAGSPKACCCGGGGGMAGQLTGMSCTCALAPSPPAPLPCCEGLAGAASSAPAVGMQCRACPVQLPCCVGLPPGVAASTAPGAQCRPC